MVNDWVSEPIGRLDVRIQRSDLLFRFLCILLLLFFRLVLSFSVVTFNLFFSYHDDVVLVGFGLDKFQSLILEDLERQADSIFLTVIVHIT